MQVAILTPTYNRVKTLRRLYSSLMNQTSNSFVWYIIDDGSSDNTKEQVDRFIQQRKVEIRYFYKKNGGKHRAINYGAKKISEDLIFMVDSDDWLMPNAIERILEYYKKYKDNESVAVLSFHKAYSNGQLSGPHYRHKEFVDNHISYRINHHIKGENAEVVKTKCFKEFPFPEIKGEKFLREGYLWISLAMKYDTVYIDEPIYIFEYLQDGLTKNLTKIRADNPKGVVLGQRLCLNKKIALIPRIKSTIRYIAYGRMAKYSPKELFQKTKSKVLFAMLYPVGMLYYQRVKK